MAGMPCSAWKSTPLWNGSSFAELVPLADDRVLRHGRHGATGWRQHLLAQVVASAERLEVLARAFPAAAAGPVVGNLRRVGQGAAWRAARDPAEQVEGVGDRSAGEGIGDLGQLRQAQRR
jgi:hypothetical protein